MTFLNCSVLSLQCRLRSPRTTRIDLGLFQLGLVHLSPQQNIIRQNLKERDRKYILCSISNQNSRRCQLYLLPVHTVCRSHDPLFPDQCSSTEMVIRALRVILERDLRQESQNNCCHVTFSSNLKTRTKGKSTLIFRFSFLKNLCV